MAQAKRDLNYVTTMMGVSFDDGLTPLNLNIDPATGRLLVTAVVTASVTAGVSGSLQYGLNASIAITVTDTVKSYTAITGDKLRGFIATGNRSGLFRLKVNGTAALSGRIAPGYETVDIELPITQSLTVGDVVLLEVTNEGQGTGSFEGSIIIET